MQACSAYYRLIPGVMKSRFLVLICGFVMLHVWQEEDLNPNHQIKFVGICWKGSWPSFVILVKNRRNEVWRLVCRNFVNGNVIKFRTLPSKKTAIKSRNDFQDIVIILIHSVLVVLILKKILVDSKATHD